MCVEYICMVEMEALAGRMCIGRSQTDYFIIVQIKIQSDYVLFLACIIDPASVAYPSCVRWRVLNSVDSAYKFVPNPSD